MWGLTPAGAADVLAVKESGGQPAQVQEAVRELQGHQMRRYQAFARQVKLPPITVRDERMLEVGGTVKVALARVGQLSRQEREALAGQFGVPGGVIDKVAERVASRAQRGQPLAQELRTAVIDYRFLQGEWSRYHPAGEGQKIKTKALEALQAGDVTKAWALYDGLSKPQPPVMARPAPPTSLRIVAAQ